jgi:hypothetical protein
LSDACIPEDSECRKKFLLKITIIVSSAAYYSLGQSGR